MPNLKTQGQLMEEEDKFRDYEKALRALGWEEADGVWYNQYGASFNFEEACEFMGFPK